MRKLRLGDRKDLSKVPQWVSGRELTRWSQIPLVSMEPPSQVSQRPPNAPGAWLLKSLPSVLPPGPAPWGFLTALRQPTRQFTLLGSAMPRCSSVERMRCGRRSWVPGRGWGREAEGYWLAPAFPPGGAYMRVPPVHYLRWTLLSPCLNEETEA